jgi:hypothetical protein
MLVGVGEEKQDIALAIDPGSKYDGYCVSGTQDIVLMGMTVLPSRVKERMETRSMLRRSRRSRKCRRREARFDSRKKKEGWIAPSQLAKVQLRQRIMERMCQIIPVTDIIVEDVRYNHYKYRTGANFSTVEIGKAKLYDAAERLATLWKCNGWETAETRKVFGIVKCKEKNALSTESHANDALAMVCWLNGEKPNTNAPFMVWRRQGTSKKQLHLQNPASGGARKRYGGTTYPGSDWRKGDVIRHRSGTTGYVGGWTSSGKVVSMTGTDGKRISQFSIGTLELLRRAPNILTERRLIPAASSGVSAAKGVS